MVKHKDMQVFYGEFENEQKKDKKCLTYRSGDSNPRFSVIFPPMISIFMEGEGDKIKSKQASSKRDRTLKEIKRSAYFSAHQLVFNWIIKVENWH